MTTLAAVKSPEEEARNPRPSGQRDVPNEGPREEFEVVANRGSEEDSDGYGHGV